MQYEEEGDMVPDEFSDSAAEEDMDEFVSDNEVFEVRPSVSSRGSMARNQQRATEAKPQVENKGM